jgi:putative FmdB family regulatory protein
VPIYEYLCEGCGNVTEVIQKLDEPGPKTCPECGSRKIAKLVSRSAFQLKGGGWYADLYSSTTKTPKDAGAAKGETGAKGEAGAKGDPGAKGTPAKADAARPAPAAAKPEAKPAAAPKAAAAKKGE